MDDIENEDPEILAERARRERAIPRLKRIARGAGWTSFIATLSPFALVTIGLMLRSLVHEDGVIAYAMLSMVGAFLVGPISAMIGIGCAIRVRTLGGTGVRASVMLCLPGVLAWPLGIGFVLLAAGRSF